MADVNIPEQYKACVYDQPGKISTKVEMLDTPEPGPGEVLINLYVPPAPIPLVNEPPFFFCMF